eukprot:COSAG04_NODE_13948_length_586_cov_0.858316_1_plen_76_part_00
MQAVRDRSQSLVLEELLAPVGGLGALRAREVLLEVEAPHHLEHAVLEALREVAEQAANQCQDIAKVVTHRAKASR